jgi:hypothetical protein
MLQLASMVWHGLTLTMRTQSVCPLNVFLQLPVSTSHCRIVVSRDAVNLCESMLCDAV